MVPFLQNNFFEEFYKISARSYVMKTYIGKDLKEL